MCASCRRAPWSSRPRARSRAPRTAVVTSRRRRRAEAMYFSPTFYVLVAAVFAAVQFIPREGVRLRAAVLALAGIIGIGTVLQVSAMSAVVLAVSVAALLVGSRLVAARATAASTGLLLLVAGPLLIAWLVGKVASSIGWTRLTP